MNIILISPTPVWPIVSGYELRMYNLCRHLARSHKISLVAHSLEQPSEESLAIMRKQFASVDVFVVPPVSTKETSRSLSAKLSELWQSPTSYFEPDGYYPGVASHISKMASRGIFDIVLFGGWGLWRYMKDIGSMPYVVDMVDDPSVFLKRQILTAAGLRAKLSGLKDWYLMRRFESELIGTFGHLIMVSFSDAKVTRKLCPRATVYVVPMGVDADFYSPAEARNRDRPILMFSGIMDYEPNVAAAEYFCRRVFPLIQSKIPDVKLLIVGNRPLPSVVRLQIDVPGVEVTGFVDDIRESFGRALVYVCPLLSGSGMKIKVFEAWAMQLPVVATSLSCEGIAVSPGRDILVADSPHEFASEVVRLLNDPLLRDRLGRAGREKAVDHYSWESKAAEMEQILRRRLATGSKKSRPNSSEYLNKYYVQDD